MRAIKTTSRREKDEIRCPKKLKIQIVHTMRNLSEEKARSFKLEITEPLSLEEAKKVLHELRVHQIELEMQNDELNRAQGKLESL